jgi:hypothetical protein
MPMQLIDTHISAKSVTMRLANDEPAAAAELVELMVPVERLMLADGKTPLGDLRQKRLVTIQLATLHYVRDAIADEIQRLSDLLAATR